MSPGKEDLRLAYERVGLSHKAVSEMRAKLLGLLPLATGAGAFALLRGQSPFLGPVGVFGIVITIGLYMYELRGIQRCCRLETQGQLLERERLGLTREQGPFRNAPERMFGGMLGAPGAGVVVYMAVVFAWLFVAGVGFAWWDEHNALAVWVLGPGYVVMVVVAWTLIQLQLKEWKGASDPASESRSER